ncbi:MAG: hypothetical protein R6U04_12485 [Bacteroidales bacterium]
MHYNSRNQAVVLTDADYKKLTKIAKCLINKVDMPQLGLYSMASQNDLWLNLVLQFCIVSGKIMTDDLRADKKRLHEFREKLNFRLLSSMQNNRKEYISKVLKEYKATSFYNKQAERIEEVLNSTNVINHNELVLLKGIDHRRQNYKEIRALLMSRVPNLKLKSASGFMVEKGLSLDVIAISTRVGDILKQHFDLNIDNQKIQSSRKLYETIESSLRQGCNKIGIPLAYLSRMLFHYSEKDTITYILEDT